MSSVPVRKRYAAQIVLWVGICLAIPLWREFQEPSQPLWNTILALFLIALVASTYFGVRYLQRNNVEVGEARFSATEREHR